MIVESLDKTVKGQVLSYDYDKDFARVYNWYNLEGSYIIVLLHFQ